jgi:hypothetical protein
MTLSYRERSYAQKNLLNLNSSNHAAVKTYAVVNVVPLFFDMMRYNI